jgi:hypothetical protein
MIRILLIFFIPLLLNASKILSYNIYDRTDRVDVMITFDTPYEGVIKQKRTTSQIVIKLLDAKIESPKLKQLSSKFLHSLSITPMLKYTKIIASVPKDINLRASKTTDGYGLRLRFSLKATKKSNTQASSNPLSNLPTKKDDALSKDYYIVVGILVIGILILLFIKKKTTSKKPKTKENSWLFKENNDAKEDKNLKQKSDTLELNDKNASIRFEKRLNDSNSVVMLDFAQYSYLLLLGNTNNILLDKFVDDKPQTQEEFETILQNRHEELNEFLKVEVKPTQQEEALQAYTKKAASISYEV